MKPMSTETILTIAPTVRDEDLARAAAVLSNGGILVVPTDTVYGIGCDAANHEAVAEVLAAKGRGRQMPPPVLVASVDAIDTLCVDVPDAARALARAFWPGALTLILRARPDLGDRRHRPDARPAADGRLRQHPRRSARPRADDLAGPALPAGRDL